MIIMMFNGKKLSVYVYMGEGSCFLLLRHSANSSIAQEERPATSSYLVTRLHLPHAIVVRLHVRKICVDILTSESAGLIGV